MKRKRLKKDFRSNILFIKLQDYIVACDITPTEKLKRTISLIDFWEKEGDEYMRLINKIEEEGDEEGFNSFFLDLGYWFRFKLLCEGKEPTTDNVVKNGLDLYALRAFMKDLWGFK